MVSFLFFIISYTVLYLFIYGARKRQGNPRPLQRNAAGRKNGGGADKNTPHSGCGRRPRG